MGHALVKFRQDWGLSCAELASRAGTSRQTIHRIEAGKQTPSLALVSRLIAISAGGLRADDFLPDAATEDADAAT